METASNRRALPRLHLVTDDAVLAEPGFARRARLALERGGSQVALHLRGPRTPGGRLYRLAAELLPAARALGAVLLVNDRLDVALAAGADGVQLGARSLRTADARALLGAGARVGVSVHRAEEARRAVAEGADFLLAGWIFATASHPGQPGRGVHWLAGVAAVRAPVVAIGGVSPERVRPVRSAGAHGVAVLGGVWSAADCAQAVERYLSELQEE